MVLRATRNAELLKCGVEPRKTKLVNKISVFTRFAIPTIYVLILFIDKELKFYFAVREMNYIFISFLLILFIVIVPEIIALLYYRGGLSGDNTRKLQKLIIRFVIWDFIIVGLIVLAAVIWYSCIYLYHGGTFHC